LHLKVSPINLLIIVKKISGRRKAAEGKRKRKTEEEEIASKYRDINHVHSR